MKVSIVVTAYNIENYIEKCLQSLINQTYKDIEIIVVDDGSIDNTYKKIKRMQLMDKRIVMISQKNKGVQAARKKGFEFSNGEYFLLVDGDDYLEKECIAELVKCVSDNKYDFVYYNINIIKNNEKKQYVAQIDYKNSIDSDFLKIYMSSKSMQNGLYCKFIKKDFIIKNKINILSSSYSMGEDLLDTIILGLYKPKVYYLNKCLYNYVRHSDSITGSGKNKIQILDIFNYIDENFKLDKIEMYKEVYQYFKFNETFVPYCLLEQNNSVKKEVYIWWMKQKINIENNRLFKKYKMFYDSKLIEKMFYYNIDFELGYKMDKLIFQNNANNAKRLSIENDSHRVNDVKRIKMYNDLYESIFKLESYDILKEYLKENNIKNIILYGYSNLALYLKNRIKTYKFIKNVWIADGYTYCKNVINIQNNKDIFDISDIIFIIPIHAYERIYSILLMQNINQTKIVNINNVLKKEG
ncbi:glycosyltransferase family 2 protein [Clostridium sp. BJN0001]|uniref:glycosyltransferase family 2 protein n=1 Tax=Clostridium sp. BJN0001 TaxID=2930219 RepID=UPI001FD2AEFB|nr:glycosyltransferase family 2 protein [Clostridium sp. BJN0001]